jgi:hypothetical protein
MVGVLDFIPLMRYAFDWVPAKIYAIVGYVMFAYLFSWTDTHWYIISHLIFEWTRTDTYHGLTPTG